MHEASMEMKVINFSAVIISFNSWALNIQMMHNPRHRVSVRVFSVCVYVYVYVFVYVVCMYTVWRVCTLHLCQLGYTNVRVRPYDSV